MDAVEFLKEKARMCEEYDYCNGCQINKARENTICQYWFTLHPEEAVAIVEKWSKKHPRKTYVMDFLEKFPNAKVLPSGEIPTCIKYVYPNADVDCNKSICAMCWTKPMKEK